MGCLLAFSYNPIRLSDTFNNYATCFLDKLLLRRDICKRLFNPFIINTTPFYGKYIEACATKGCKIQLYVLKCD